MHVLIAIALLLGSSSLDPSFARSQQSLRLKRRKPAPPLCPTRTPSSPATNAPDAILPGPTTAKWARTGACAAATANGRHRDRRERILREAP